jgi:uncharacterized protein (UPF0548 family)
MTEWRFGRGWQGDEIGERLRALDSLPRNFDADEQMTTENGWNNYFLESVVAREDLEQNDKFDRLAQGVTNYEFSDPTIVRAHFDRLAPLLGRRMLLDIQALRLHYLCPTVVTKVRDERGPMGRVFGFRYDTLVGHIETGVEWFLLTKTSNGDIQFRIDALWRRGQFPNWWSEVGFNLLARRYQLAWHRQAQRRMSALAHQNTN